MIETGRVPKPTAPPAKPPASPPTRIAPIAEPIFGPPPIHIPPVMPPPDMPPPEEPPVDMPEPGMLIILFTAALVFWRIARPTPN